MLAGVDTRASAKVTRRTGHRQAEKPKSPGPRKQLFGLSAQEIFRPGQIDRVRLATTGTARLRPRGATKAKRFVNQFARHRIPRWDLRIPAPLIVERGNHLARQEQEHRTHPRPHEPAFQRQAPPPAPAGVPTGAASLSTIFCPRMNSDTLAFICLVSIVPRTFSQIGGFKKRERTRRRVVGCRRRTPACCVGPAPDVTARPKVAGLYRTN
jgi:hypothetical protein